LRHSVERKIPADHRCNAVGGVSFLIAHIPRICGMSRTPLFLPRAQHSHGMKTSTYL
jgi:hypothetical protein